MKISANDFDDYFAQTGQYEADLRKLDKFIRQTVPKLDPIVNPAMGGGVFLGYGPMEYRTKSAKQPITWPLLAIASQKNYMALYACAVIDGQYAAEKYQADLGKVNCGKSCIRFKKLQDLNLETVAKLIKDLEKRYLSGEKLFGH